jgi:hypothetical protein
MANLVSKIEFPRNSPQALIAMAEIVSAKYAENPELIPIPKQVMASLQEKVQAAKAMREEAQKLAARAVELNGIADKALGIAIGQSLNDDTTVSGSVALFRDYAALVFKNDIEQLKNFGYDVKVTQKAARISQKRREQIRAEKA